VTSRIGPQGDRLIVAQLSGIVSRYARWEPPDEATTAAAVAELREISNGRADLLAEVAGVALGFYHGTLDAPRAANKAAFCRLAGADEAQIPGWVEIGLERAAQALLPPFSQSRQGRPPGLG
jgi:hypothetical protein